MRLCTNPACRREISGCMGTCKASDIQEWIAGSREQCDVRELCEKCATAAVVAFAGGLWLGYSYLVGWGTPLLPPPRPA